MGSSLAGLLILAVLLTASLMIWRVNLSGNDLVSSASRNALQLEGERARTVPSITSAKGDRNNNPLAVTVKNDGATSAAASDFDKMDLVVFYDSAAQPPVRLTYTSNNPPPAGQWTNTAISGTFEPDVWNPAEDLTIAATLVGGTCAPGTLTVGFPNGITDTNPFTCAGLDLTFHSETTDINGTTYYTLKSETPADGTASTVSVPLTSTTTGRLAPAANAGKFVFPLTGVNIIPAANWDMTYRLKRDKVNGGWTWFVNAVDISLGTTGAWTDIDISGSVPVGATGAVVEIVNTDNSTEHHGILRSKEDTVDYMSNPNFGEIYQATHRWQIVKIDGNRVIQGRITDTDVDFKLLGYTVGSDPSYFSGNPVDISPVAANQWTTVDVSNYVSDEANGVILWVNSEVNTEKKYRIRAPGSDEAAKDKINQYANTMFIVGLNSAKHFEANLDDEDVKIYLIGETKGSVAYYGNNIIVDDPSTNNWRELDADDYGIPPAANGLFFHYDGEADDSDKIGFRHGDSTDNWNKDIFDDTHYQAAVGLRDSDNVWEEFMGDSKVDVWIAGFTKLTDLDVVANVDVIIRKADDTIRTTLLTNVADTSLLTGSDWQTSTITFAFPGYTVVDATDYLEVDIYAESSSNNSGETVSVDFRIDDPSLAVADQMKLAEVVP
ncbi:MAG: hypothetical protein H8E48_13175 [Chloroflexi bacterium]|nr:hypothetical protein [Chloroflexota bacterium]